MGCSPEGPRGVTTFLSWQAAVCPHHLDAVPGLHLVHQVIVQNDVHRARQLPCRGLLRHLLDGDGLVVLVDREAKLCLQGVVLFILKEEVKGLATFFGSTGKRDCITQHTEDYCKGLPEPGAHQLPRSNPAGPLIPSKPCP